MSPIFGENLENIAITGEAFSTAPAKRGAGEKFKLTEMEWKELLASGGTLDQQGKTWWPSKRR
jgi:hypothetical protein